jgi:hypothetical protein
MGLAAGNKLLPFHASLDLAALLRDTPPVFVAHLAKK